jgi:hypothetical protein
MVDEDASELEDAVAASNATAPRAGEASPNGSERARRSTALNLLMAGALLDDIGRGELLVP